MRKIQLRRSSGTTGVRRRIALIGTTLGLVGATIGLGAAGFGAAPSGLQLAHTVAHTVADSSPDTSTQYGGGLLMAADPNGGYWTVDWSGDVTSHGGAPTFGSPALAGVHLTRPIIAMAATPDGMGYWLVATDGGVFAYGDAPFYGSTGAFHLNDPVVGIAPTPDGLGYWLVASDGGVFTFGDAPFYGSTGAMRLNQPIVGVASTADGLGYWLVASDGGVFTFGDAPFYGSTGAIHLNRSIVGMTATPDGDGYWLVASDGGVFTYGDAGFYGSLGGGTQSVLGMMVSPPNQGYVLVTGSGAASVFPSANPSATPSGGPAPSGVSPPLFSTTATTPVPTPGPSALDNDCRPTAAPVAAPDEALNELISGQVGPGWVGGDATYSTELPNGSEAFVFSDTLLGAAQPSGAATLTGFTHNSELVGSLSGLRTNTGGTPSAPQTLIPDTTDPGDQWQVSATDVENGYQLVFVNEFAPATGGSLFDRYTGVSGIAALSIPLDGLPAYSSVTVMSRDINTEWGNAVMQSGPYTYVYGNYSSVPGTFMAMKLARVPLGQSLDAASWEYWNGVAWVSGESNAAPISTTNQLTGVTTQPDGGGYMGVSTTPSVTATSVELSYACTPTGPWTVPEPVYAIPQLNQFPGEMAYIPTFHPELSSDGSLVASYNLNSLVGYTSLEQNVHEYQPSFLKISMAQS